MSMMRHLLRRPGFRSPHMCVPIKEPGAECKVTTMLAHYITPSNPN